MSSRSLGDVLRDVVGDRVQRAVADSVGVGESAVSGWLAGRFRPELATLQVMLDVCEASPGLTVEALAAFGVDDALLASPEDIAARRRLQSAAVSIGP